MRTFIALLFIGFTSCSDIFNVGTVLWHRTDSLKQCWSASEKDFLTARRIMQGLLPEPEMVDFAKGGAITALLQYFRMSFQIVKDGTSGETQEHLLRALADAVGGYLKRIALPITRQLFYSGWITFEEANTIHHLFDDLKAFLQTAGQGWKLPEPSDRIPITAAPLEFSTTGDKTSCDFLIFEEDHFYNKTSGDSKNRGMIPLPTLDNAQKPTAVAVPLIKSSLASLTSPDSEDLISRYYKFAVECIVAKTGEKEDLDKFNEAVFGWIANEIMPHLDDDVWYIGFGRILQIAQTIRGSGIDTSVLVKPNRTTRFLFKDGIEYGGKAIPKFFNKFLGSFKSQVEVFVLLFMILSLILAGIFYKLTRKQDTEEKVEQKSSVITSATSFSNNSKVKPFRALNCLTESSDFPIAVRSYPTMSSSSYRRRESGSSERSDTSSESSQ